MTTTQNPATALRRLVAATLQALFDHQAHVDMAHTDLIGECGF